MFKEWDEGRSHAHKLLGRDIHEGDVLRSYHNKLSSSSCRDKWDIEPSLLIQRGIGLGYNVLLLFQCGQELYFLRNLAALDNPVRGLYKAILIDPTIC